MPRLRLVLRTLTFVACAAFIIGGPVYKQGLKRPSKVLFQWVMFSGFGVDVCDVRFSEADSAGDRHRVDRYEVLGYESAAAAPKSIRKLKDKTAVEQIAKRMCRKLPEGTDLRVFARCATRKGWKTELKPTENLCAPG